MAALSFGDVPTITDMKAAIRSTANEKAVGPGLRPVKLLKFYYPITLEQFLLIILSV